METDFFFLILNHRIQKEVDQYISRIGGGGDKNGNCQFWFW